VLHTSEVMTRDVLRAAGVLLHPTSLPGRYGIGDLGDELVAFLDWAASAGTSVWQVLPLNPPGYGSSPYGCLSSYAGNPLLISPQRLVQNGLLPARSVEELPSFPDGRVDFDAVSALKMRLLRESLACFEAKGRIEQKDDFKRFESDNKWLPDWTLYASLKAQHGGREWSAWPHELVIRDKGALEASTRELAGEIRFQKYIQWLFFVQWGEVRRAAAERHIRIMGDVPIYVAADSADVWANRHLFELDEQGAPSVVAGVPPDYFSATGQRWGNPLYRWDRMQETNFRWWVSRIRAALRFADVIRLDHFRGFAAYWEIPASEPTAIHGRWKPGPGKPLFDAIRAGVGDVPLVAEDLGFITDEVNELRRSVGLPGMKILQFGFGDVDSPHLPHRYERKTVVYTGTHDNDTAVGWYEQATPAERELAREYLGCDAEDVAWGLTRSAYLSVAETAIVPVQDILGLGSEARMNRPGATGDNWSWRVLPGALTGAHAERLRRLAAISGRA
jgi:4-alpha-glucanotransferase